MVTAPQVSVSTSDLAADMGHVNVVLRTEWFDSPHRVVQAVADFWIALSAYISTWAATSLPAERNNVSFAIFVSFMKCTITA